jgi:hypothetical protein
MEKSPWKANSHSVKFHASYGTRRFITVLRTVRHLASSWARCIQSTPSHPSSLRSILTLSFHLHLDLKSNLIPSDFPNKILYALFISHACYISRPSHPQLFNHPNICWSVQVHNIDTPHFLNHFVCWNSGLIEGFACGYVNNKSSTWFFNDCRPCFLRSREFDFSLLFLFLGPCEGNSVLRVL